MGSSPTYCPEVQRYMHPSIKKLVVYVPSHDYAISQAFYQALGFTLTEGWGDTIDCSLGGATFRLQNYYNKDWAENFMMKFDVDDVDRWYEHCKRVLTANKYAHARVAPPEMVGDTKIMHIWDPCGVLLIFIQ
jgi:hypothetical protein